jgi:hypothetical protein
MSRSAMACRWLDRVQTSRLLRLVEAVALLQRKPPSVVVML